MNQFFDFYAIFFKKIFFFEKNVSFFYKKQSRIKKFVLSLYSKREVQKVDSEYPK